MADVNQDKPASPPAICTACNLQGHLLYMQAANLSSTEAWSGNRWIQKGFLKEDKAGSWHVQVLILPLSHQQHHHSTAKWCFFVPSHTPFHFFSFIKYVSRNNFLLFNIKFLLTSPSFPRLNQHNFVNCEFTPFCALYTALISEFTQFCFTWFRGSFCFYTENKNTFPPSNRQYL